MWGERYLVVDVETTGFSPAADRVVEVACVAVDGNRIVDRWATLVNPGRPIPERATAIHGITDAMVADAPSLDKALAQLRPRCADRLLAAHYAQFDLSFLRELGIDAALCTMRLARALVPESPNHKNQTLRAFLGLDRMMGEALGAHRALDDATVSAHVLLACRRRFLARGAGSWGSFLRARALVQSDRCVRRAS